MQPELGRGHVAARPGRVARGTAKWRCSMCASPGETLHLVCAAGLGVGVLDGESRAQLRERDARRDRLAGAGLLAGALRGGARAGGPARPSSSRARADVVRAEAARRARARERDALRVEDGDAAPEARLADRPRARRARGARHRRGARRHRRSTDRRDALRRALVQAIARVARRVGRGAGRPGAKTESADALALRAQLFVAEAAPARRGGRTGCAPSTGRAERPGRHRAADRPGAQREGAARRRSSSAPAGSRRAPGFARARLGETQAGRRAALDEAARRARGRRRRPRSPRGAARGPRRRATSSSARAPATASAATRSSRRAAAARALRYRTFVGASGARILVGRGAAHNDALTLHVARPHDLWLARQGPERRARRRGPREGGLVPARSPRRSGAPRGALLGRARRAHRRRPVHAPALPPEAPRQRAGARASSTARRSSSCARTTSCCAGSLEGEARLGTPLRRRQSKRLTPLAPAGRRPGVAMASCPSGRIVEKAWKTWNISGHTSHVTSTPAARALAAKRRVSSSRISESPACISSGGSPVRSP